MALTANSIMTPQSPFSRTAVVTTAEVGFNAPTNVIDLLLAADNVNGARLTKLVALPRGTIGSANNIQIYERTGATYTLIESALMAVVTPAAGVANPKTDFGVSDTNPLIVRSGYGLAAACGVSVANGIVIKAEGGLF